MSRATQSHPLILFLEGFRERDDKKALADLRRGLNGDPQVQIAFMSRYVGRFTENLPRWLEQQYYLIASLYAYYPEQTTQGNMGDHFWEKVDPSNPDSLAPVEKRFSNLLAAHQDELHYHLRQAISYLKADNIAINWHQLAHDIRGWSHPDRFVQRNWANAFWQKQPVELTEQADS